MSYTCLYDDHGAQTLRLPPLFRFDSSHVTLERMDDGILIKPVKEKLTLDRLFAMIDEARREEGYLDLDRSGKVPSQTAWYWLNKEFEKLNSLTGEKKR